MRCVQITTPFGTTSSERINRPVQNPRQLLHFLQPMVALYLYPARVTTMEVKSVGTFPVILLKLATPPLPPQTKLNLEQNG